MYKYTHIMCVCVLHTHTHTHTHTQTGRGARVTNLQDEAQEKTQGQPPYRQAFSKVISTMALYSKRTRALTFENVCLVA